MSDNTGVITKRKVFLTYDDYECFPDDGNRHEIIEGEHYMTPSPITKHQRISLRIEMIIATYLKKYKKSEIFHAPIDVILSNINIVQPDIIYISKERAHIITTKNIQGSPDLIIEIISESSRRNDKILKKNLYEQYRVKEYWVIDPVIDTLEIYRLTEDGYKKIGEYEKNHTITTPLLEGLSINLEEIFNEEM